MSSDRLVDYVFIAGLPNDFHIDLLEKSPPDLEFKSKDLHNAKSNASTTQSHSDDAELAEVASEHSADILFENIRSSISRFDHERDEFLKAIGRASMSKIPEDAHGDRISFINRHNSTSRGRSLYMGNSLKNVDENSSDLTHQNNLIAEENEQRRTSYLNVAPISQDSEATEKENHPLKLKFSPRLLARYPQTDYSSQEDFPSYIPMFCFPNDITICESEEIPSATYHGFVMTQEDGSKRYGGCLTIYESLPDRLVKEVKALHDQWCQENLTVNEIDYCAHLAEKIRDEKQRIKLAQMKISQHGAQMTSQVLAETERERAEAEEKLALYTQLLQPTKLGVIDTSNLWIPKCIGVICQLPWHDVMRDWLCAVACPSVEGLKPSKQQNRNLPLERYIINIVHEVPLPPPGRLQVAITVDDTQLFCSRPALNQIPIMKDFSLYTLFRSLSVKNILTLFEVALAEGKILLISSYPDMLFVVAHSISYLIYPLSWQGVFIPILPARLIGCVQAPVPYIMGIERQYKGMDLLPEDACIVDLDKDCIMIGEMPCQIPPRQKRKLVQSLEAYAPLHSHYNIPFGPPLYLQQAYPHNRFMPVSEKSRIFEQNKRITSVVGMPVRSNPMTFAASNRNNHRNSVMVPDAYIPPDVGIPPTVQYASNRFSRSNFSLQSVPAPGYQRRFSTSTAVEGRDKSVKSEKIFSATEKFNRKPKDRFGTLNSARNSILAFGSKTLNRQSVFGLKNSGINTKGNMSIPESVQHDNLSLHDDASSILLDPSERIPTDHKFLPREGHLMVEIEDDDSSENGITTWMLEGLACGICKESLGINSVFKCEGCSMVVHEECLDDIAYPCMPACFDEQKVHDAFLRVFASLFSNYRNFLATQLGGVGDIHKDGDHDRRLTILMEDNEVFKKDAFLKLAEKEAKPFLSRLVDSQAFSHFIYERVVSPPDKHDIRYFDEMITAKLNRSKLRLAKEATFFLDDTSYAVTQTLRAVQPKAGELDDSQVESKKTLPSSFNPRLMYKPRPRQSLRHLM